MNFLKNDNSAYLIIESASGSSNSYVIAFIIFIIVFVLLGLATLGSIVYACCCESSNKHKKSEIEDCQYSSANMNLMPQDGTAYDPNVGEKPYYMK